MTPTKTTTTPGAVPFTRQSLDTLRALVVRFAELQKPLPDHLIVELALMRLYNEYCLYDSDIRPSDLTSTRLIKKNSKAVLDARYREYTDLEVVTYRSRRTTA